MANQLNFSKSFGSGGLTQIPGQSVANDYSFLQPAALAVLGENTTKQPGPTTTTGGVDSGALNQAINNYQAGINRLGDTKQSAYSTIDTQLTDALNQLLGGYKTAQQGYNTANLQSRQDYSAGKNTIGANAGNLLSGLRRLLGSRGAGGSSAYDIAAPQAVAQGASGQYADLANTFGRNQGALDTSWNNYLTDYGNQVSSAKTQAQRQKQEAAQSVESQKAGILQSIAGLQAQAGNSAAAQPYLNQANSILDNLASYTVKPINYKTNAYASPDLSKYTTSPVATNYQSQQSNDYFSPYLGALLGKKQQQFA